MPSCGLAQMADREAGPRKGGDSAAASDRGNRASARRTTRDDGARSSRSSGPTRGADRTARGAERDRRSGPVARPRRSPVAGSEAEADIPDADVSILPKIVLEDLASLGGGLPDKVGRLLAAARLASDENPEAAFAFARRARGMAPRSAVVRETLGVTAYRVEDYSTARKELQAARRMSANPEMLPLLADCERALGSPERALEIALSPEARRLTGADGVELLIVAAGARLDLGDADAAVAMLSRQASAARESQPWAVRLVYAYASALESAGRRADARKCWEHCIELDTEESTDAPARLADCISQ